jgi:tRNA uridine 5-carboxymethylaminomethyl modification enzyme
VGEDRRIAFQAKSEALAAGRDKLTSQNWTPSELIAAGLNVNQDGSRRDGMQLLAFPDLGFDDLLPLDPSLADIAPDIRAQLEKDALYANYIERQQRDVEALKRDEGQVIPADFKYEPIDGLSNELKAKLSRARPENLAQAGRVDGMTPAALALLLARLKQGKREKSA